MKILSLLLIIPLISFSGCADVPTIQQDSPVAHVGQDLGADAIAAIADWAHVSTGGVDYAWAVSAGLDAYKDIAKTAADVKALVAVWTAGKGTALADRLALLFQTSSGTPAQKLAAIAQAARTAATEADPDTSQVLLARRPLNAAEKSQIHQLAFDTGVSFIKNAGTDEAHVKQLLVRRLSYKFRVVASALKSLAEAGFEEGAKSVGADQSAHSSP